MAYRQTYRQLLFKKQDLKNNNVLFLGTFDYEGAQAATLSFSRLIICYVGYCLLNCVNGKSIRTFDITPVIPWICLLCQCSSVKRRTYIFVTEKSFFSHIIHHYEVFVRIITRRNICKYFVFFRNEHTSYYVDLFALW